MSRGSVVLDTSALLALMYKESGSDQVLERIVANGGQMSSVNLAELVSKQAGYNLPRYIDLCSTYRH